VDIIVAQGWEAGGHTGEVASMVLTPEVVDAVAPAPVLSAGGIGSGRQLAAALALGAQGAWTGSIWLGATELEMPANQTEVVINATSSDTIRSRSLTGKPARQVKTPWIEFWEDPNTPMPLQMPLQYLVTNDAMNRMRAADRFDLLGTPGGQIVGSIRHARSVADIVASIRDEVIDSANWLEGALADEGSDA
jgi:NAD(P)H-dependent flavin oxidoreductase YrpB (nitropropane dioxygenase family)